MYSRGMRPFQPVVYLTNQMRSLLEWKGFVLSDLFNFSSISQALEGEEIAKFLLLNSGNEDTERQLPHSLGTETIMNQWSQEVSILDDEVLKMSLKQVQDELVLKKHSALNKLLEYPLKEDQPYELVHDERFIFVVLQLDSNESNSLSDRKTIDSLLQNNTMVKALTKDIIKTYGCYFPYDVVSTSPWFSSYIVQL